jgi:hypothetical protein
MAGKRRTRPVTAGGLKRGAAIPRLEVEGAPDRGAPPVSPWCKSKREARSWAGGGSELGRCGPQARARRKAAGLGASRAKRRVGPVVKKEERRGGRLSFFF